MPRVAYRSVSHRLTPSPVQENNYNYDRHPHARGDCSRPYPSLGNVMDRSSTADPDDGFTDIGFRDFVQASRRVSRRKLARIETNPYASELLSRGVDVTHEPMETFGSILDTSVTHTNNVGTMLMDELAYAQTRIDTRKEETKKLEDWKDSMQDVIHGQEDSIVRQSADLDLVKGELTTLKDLVRALVAKTGELEDNKIRLNRCVSELTGEVRELQRRCSEPGVRVEEEEPMIPERAESPPARFVVPVEGRLVPIDDEVIEIGSNEFYENLGVVRRDTPRPGMRRTPLITVTDYTQPRGRWPVQDFDPYACQGHSTPTTTSALSRLRRVVRDHYKSSRNPKEKPNLNQASQGLTNKGLSLQQD
ncbi:hypothetical protein BJ322DRAFT_1105014 [Thelephora terrestris]|uniref:Uncharacterized protein n=1 Tax=Thelephora terrestris TaxID=56493 RepID=A0A9P6L9W3_9AGAM|nr:hypothetical protein BJ322DRAFT_1105014 [Thelephora terrestris]